MNRRGQLLRKFWKSKNETKLETKEINIQTWFEKQENNAIKSWKLTKKKTRKKFWKTIKEVFPGKNTNIISSSFLPIKSDTAFGISENNNVNIFCKCFSFVLNLLKNETMPINDFAWGSPVEIKSKTGIECNFEYVPQIFVEREMRSLNDLNAGY